MALDADDADSLPLDLPDLTEPDDQGLSLDELSQAYAALLRKGTDPYPQPGAPTSAVESTADSPAPEFTTVIRGSDDDACEVSPKTILEAVLFVGHPTSEPLTSERIAALMRGVRTDEVDELAAELNGEYAASGCPYVIVSIDAGYRLVLRDEWAAMRDAFYGRIREARLSQSAIDVLAIVAYQQPVPADEIDRLRGKPSGGILSQLVRRDLLSIERPGDRKAKPVYCTTDRFLDLFDLGALADLPRSQELEREF
jgi:segregation and condensation protein B